MLIRNIEGGGLNSSPPSCFVSRAVVLYHDRGGGVLRPRWRCIMIAVEVCHDCGGDVSRLRWCGD